MPQYVCSVGRFSDQDISSGGVQTVVWDRLFTNNGGGLSFTAGTDYIQVVVSGFYVAEAAVVYSANPCGSRHLTFRIADGPSGTSIGHSVVVPAATGANETRLVLQKLLYLRAGDRVRVEVYQDSGASLNLTAYPAGTTTNFYEPILALYSV